ncbi:ROK family protein [Dactylosporangium siamense]|uniref:Glucokinase n=1 Tax=Dactylosporangium siamense TaxID=685454 RepID=A0A919PVP3_9ACTN|nr:ROK family protein [Dactylosporangium siamense]GIG50136.1 glucokinase [Dactylosporangium siamense]
MHSRLTVGVDVGGTRTKLALIDPEPGLVLSEAVHPTITEGREAFLTGLAGHVRQLAGSAGVDTGAVRGVGIGLPGFVLDDLVDLVWPELAFLEGTTLRAEAEDALGLPVVFDNDARVVALGEARHGGHPGTRLLSLTIGTGLGVALVVDGRLQERGSLTHLAGHLPVRPGARPCFCGFAGCLESLVCAGRLTDETGLPDAATVLATAGSPAVAGWLADLATGLNAYAHLYAPDVVVIGGGLSRGLAPHLPALADALFAQPYHGYTVELRRTDLAERAGSLGAAALLD